jgi:hypothetical protein
MNRFVEDTEHKDHETEANITRQIKRPNQSETSVVGEKPYTHTPAYHMLNHYSMLLIGRPSAVHYHHPLQRDLSLDQAKLDLYLSRRDWVHSDGYWFQGKRIDVKQETLSG